MGEQNCPCLFRIWKIVRGGSQVSTSNRVTASQEDTFPRPVVLRGVRAIVAAGEVHLVWIIGGTNDCEDELLAWFDVYSGSLVIANVVRVKDVPG
jgi:hypothetical protein